MNYLPDLDFNDSRPLIQAHTLHVHFYADVQMTALFRTSVRVYVKDRKGRSEGKQLLEVITDGEGG